MGVDQLPSHRRRFIVIGLLTALAVVVALFGLSHAEPGQTPACVQFWPETRYRNYGYDHIVHVGNACHALAMCAVSSDVTPTPVRVEIKAGESMEVLIARGSPASEFTPRVECGLVL